MVVGIIDIGIGRCIWPYIVIKKTPAFAGVFLMFLVAKCSMRNFLMTKIEKNV